MSKFRHILLFCILTAVSLPLKAQDDFLKLGLRTGHNTVFGGFAAVSLESTCALCDDFSLNGGLKYNTTGKTDIAARPSYFHDFTWGRISAEVLLNYTRLASVNGMAVGGGAGISGKWIGFRLGYFYRLYGSKAGMIEEPFNIYYELRANLLPMTDKWDLQLMITNCEIFEIERHFQPTFMAEGTYSFKDHLGVSLGIGCKPAGMFNMSADYYESFLNFGFIYRW